MQRAPRICSCGLKVAHGATCICRQRRKAAADRQRPSARQRGYTTAWDKARAGFLRTHPSCVKCGAKAEHVDHIIPHDGDQRLFWDRNNWAPLCRRHHSQKTAQQDGGLGNQKQDRGVVDNFGEGSPDRAGWPTRDTPVFSRPGNGKIGEPGR